MSSIGEQLDAVAQAVFDHDVGRRRLEPLLAAYDEQVGEVRDGDEARSLLLAMRLDWALCDAVLSEPPTTWLRRAAQADLGIDPELAASLVPNVTGVFEVWPGRDGAFLRDRLHGLCLPLIEPVHLDAAPHGPAALWDVRVWIGPDGARLCRPPLPVPLAALEVLCDAAPRRFGPQAVRIDPLALRRAWLTCQRQPRLPVGPTFARFLKLDAGR